ncbi:MAG: DUF86 domain-containing protein [Xanthomonadaceae bacterium]|nr:DUF86 domain-containing protein [Xanthomonadaceae bacterium]
MADLPERDLSLLLDMLLAARDARKFIRGMEKPEFLDSDLHQSAVIRSLEIIGEAAGRISPATTKKISEIPWKKVTGMRHRLIHDYFDVDLELVWEVVHVEIPALIKTLEGLVPPEDEGSR